MECNDQYGPAIQYHKRHARGHKSKKYEIRFMGKNARFHSDYQLLNAQAVRFDFISKVDHFCKPKSSCFMCEIAVKRIAIFVHFSMLYMVYKTNYFIERWTCSF